ncbi:MAG: hydrogenase formation protein HypD [Proteobacteria bacterium]|nr:hydrogenase formation protein HypD [Pseudomonadota bacterium]
MKYIDEYRDPDIARALLSGIKKQSAAISRTVTIMEVCGSHTQAIGRYGIRGMLPKNIKLISGPGCPVCVTSVADVDTALWLAARPDMRLATFGDMMRVPGTGGRSLQQLRAEGADIRVVASATDCLGLALQNPQREIIFMGIGFETTSPTIAATVIAAQRQSIRNFTVFSVHKVIPPAITALLADPALSIDGFMCPGHVSVIIGADAYRCITDAGRAAVITGFEPVDVLEGIYLLLDQMQTEKKEVVIQDGRGVKAEGNRTAMAMLASIFEPADARWRGLGMIPGSGLVFRDAYASFDALKKFSVPELHSEDIKGCRCGDILRGIIEPPDCPLFKKVCTPQNPTGPCMVSSEGTCAAYYRYL